MKKTYTLKSGRTVQVTASNKRDSLVWGGRHYAYTASVSVDGAAVTTDVGAGWAGALTNARYSLGQHTVSVSGSFTGPGYLDVEIVTGY